MRKLMKMAVCATAVLTAAACQRERVDENVSPLYNSETKEVTTNFVLNVAAQPRTKMSAEAVQQDHNFLGMENVMMYAYASGNNYVKSFFENDPGTDQNPNANYRKVKAFSLPTLFTANNTMNQGNNNAENTSNRILQLNIPVNTDAILFYGKAIKDNPSEKQGATTITLSEVPAETEFAVVRRLGDDTKLAEYNATAALMSFVVNRILDTEAIAGESLDGYTNLPALKWSDVGQQYEINYGTHSRWTGTGPLNRDLSPLEDILGDLYSTFTFIKPGEYRAGASQAIAVQMSNIYAVLYNSAYNATPTDALEANAKRLARAIITRMNLYYDKDDNWAYRSYGLIKQSALDAGVMSETDWDAAYSTAHDLNDYPAGDFEIPDGAAQMSFDNNTLKFAYLNPNQPLLNPTLDPAIGATTFDPRKYVFPAELMYYANSSIRTTSQDVRIQDYPNGTEPWTDDQSAGNKWSSFGWATPGKVLSSTRAVAIHDNIHYGVALMKTAVTWKPTVVNQDIEDNLAVLTNNNETAQTFNQSSLDFSLKGILIGGVNARYNWQYVRKYTTSTNPGNASGYDFSKFDGVLYDTDIVDSGIPTATGSETYTLVYDNYDSSLGASQATVYVALELVNNGDPFWGMHNLIPTGGTFYLIGKLAPGDATNSIVWPSDHQVPPIDDATGASLQIPRVFIQDFMTSATFKLGENCLKHAYYSTPDLRSTQMSLGLSVDLHWETGYVFESEL